MCGVWLQLAKRKSGLGGFARISTVFMLRNCVVCGKDFTVQIDDVSGKILTPCFYGGKLRLGIGTWCSHRLDTNPDGSIKFTKILPWWKELWYRLIDLKRLILHQYTDVEYWECERCLKKIRAKQKES